MQQLYDLLYYISRLFTEVSFSKCNLCQQLKFIPSNTKEDNILQNTWVKRRVDLVSRISLNKTYIYE